MPRGDLDPLDGPAYVHMVHECTVRFCDSQYPSLEGCERLEFSAAPVTNRADILLLRSAGEASAGTHRMSSWHCM